MEKSPLANRPSGRVGTPSNNGKNRSQVLNASKLKTPNGTVTSLDKRKQAPTGARSTPNNRGSNGNARVPVSVRTSPHTSPHTRTGNFPKVVALVKAFAKRKKAFLQKYPRAGYNALAVYTANKNKGFAYMMRTNSFRFKFVTADGMDENGNWKKNLSGIKFKQDELGFSISFNQYFFAKQLEFMYYPTPKNFSGLNLSNVIDIEWYQAQNKYLRSLGTREIFLLYGFSHYGDTWAHAHLDDKLTLDQVKINLHGVYFPFFFQARDVYKVNTGDVLKDYAEVIKRINTETQIIVIKSIAQMFVDELNGLIERSPATKKPFTVFRGVKNDMYMSGIKDQQYVLNRFCSTTIHGTVAYDFSKEAGKNPHTIQRILIMPGSKCLLMFGFTRHGQELEILLPRGSTYMIRNRQTDVRLLPHGANITKNMNKQLSRVEKIENIVDIICLGMTKKYTTMKKMASIPKP